MENRVSERYDKHEKYDRCASGDRQAGGDLVRLNVPTGYLKTYMALSRSTSTELLNAAGMVIENTQSDNSDMLGDSVSVERGFLR
jgi:hypothetical protein